MVPRDKSASTYEIFKIQKEFIKDITLAKGVRMISKVRTSLHEKTEKLLMVWVTEKQLKGDTLSQGIICEKAQAIYDDLLMQTSRTPTDETSKDSFKARRGWFDNFRKKTGIYCVVRHDQAASSDAQAAENYPKMFFEQIEAEERIPQQVFNCDKPGLFWKKMPNRSYIAAVNKTIRGHKFMRIEKLSHCAPMRVATARSRLCSYTIRKTAEPLSHIRF